MLPKFIKTINSIGEFRSRRANAKIQKYNSQRNSIRLPKRVQTVALKSHSAKDLLRGLRLYNPNSYANCSGYAIRIATLFGKTFEKGHAWDLPDKNKVVAFKKFDPILKTGGIPESELKQMIRDKQITPGTIVGVHCTHSQYNSNARPFSHVIVYIGNGVFWHNYFGPKYITISELYSHTSVSQKQRFSPVAVIEPKHHTTEKRENNQKQLELNLGNA